MTWGKPPGRLMNSIAAYIEEVGEATRAEIADAIGLGVFRVSTAVTRMMRTTRNRERMIHIVRWVYDGDIGERRYPRAVYALGNKPDAKKPKVTEAERLRKYRANRKMRVASVFDLGLTVAQRRVQKSNIANQLSGTQDACNPS